MSDNLPDTLPEGMEIKKLPIKRSTSPGRSRKYQTPKQLWSAMEEYFKYVEEYNEQMKMIRRPTIAPNTGDLAKSLGFTHRGQLTYYKGLSVSFSNVVDRARLEIASWHERVAMSQTNNSIGWLKKNLPEEYGRPEEDSEGTELIVGGGGNVTINIQKNYGRTEDND